MIADIATYIGCLLLVLGAAFSLIAAIGVVRLPDLYTRMHAASKAGAVGGGIVLLAVAIMCFDGGIATRAVVGIGFLLLTTPLSAHLLARASYQSDDKSRSKLVIDELKSTNSQIVKSR
jgi:multicomponent Na+:H+ antiporter subunit G